MEIHFEVKVFFLFFVGVFRLLGVKMGLMMLVVIEFS